MFDWQKVSVMLVMLAKKQAITCTCNYGYVIDIVSPGYSKLNYCSLGAEIALQWMSLDPADD